MSAARLPSGGSCEVIGPTSSYNARIGAVRSCYAPNLGRLIAGGLRSVPLVCQALTGRVVSRAAQPIAPRLRVKVLVLNLVAMARGEQLVDSCVDNHNREDSHFSLARQLAKRHIQPRKFTAHPGRGRKERSGCQKHCGVSELRMLRREAAIWCVTADRGLATKGVAWCVCACACAPSQGPG